MSGGFTNNVWVSQTSGILNRLRIDAVTVGPNRTTNGNQGLMVEGLGTSTTNVTLQNRALTSSRGMVSQVIGNGSGGGDLDVYNNDFSNNHPQEDSASGLLGINGGATGTFSIDVSNGGTAGNHNTFQSASGHAVNIIKSNGSGTLIGTFTGTRSAWTTQRDNSGSLNGSGVRFQHAGGGGTGSMNITNNSIREYSNDGITMVASAGGVAYTGTMNANVTGNTVTDPGSDPAAIGFNGIRQTAGVLGGDSFTFCAHVKGNSAVSSRDRPHRQPRTAGHLYAGSASTRNATFPATPAPQQTPPRSPASSRTRTTRTPTAPLSMLRRRRWTLWVERGHLHRNRDRLSIISQPPRVEGLLTRNVTSHLRATPPADLGPRTSQGGPVSVILKRCGASCGSGGRDDLHSRWSRRPVTSCWSSRTLVAAVRRPGDTVVATLTSEGTAADLPDWFRPHRGMIVR